MFRLASVPLSPLMLLCASASAPVRLGGYPVEPAQVSVSGISPGICRRSPTASWGARSAPAAATTSRA
jgi:hypothetical protein